MFGEWKLCKRLGGGGNGDVWRVSRQGFVDHAIKLLRSVDNISYKRFTAEVETLTTLGGVNGIVPLVDRYLPEIRSSLAPWFVMPEAETYDKHRLGQTSQQVVEEFIELSKALSILHKKGISHRDIKPENILYWKSRLCFSDFGLVKYPNRTEITPKKQDVGPKFTMAPEMRREASEADGIPADIYSFGKTLWIALTEQKKGFDGQYSANSVLALKRYLPNCYTTTLDQLLTECTDNDPRKRPTMDQITARLEEWLALINDFHTRNLAEWTEVQQILFPAEAPTRATWTQMDSICSVLNEIAKVQSLNHMFYPSGGGNTITGVSRATEHGMIALHVGKKIAELLKPAKLTYESFGYDANWNYFRLEVAPVEPTGIQGALGHDGISETLTELVPGQYVSYRHWDNNDYSGQPLPPESRPISRFLKGCFVFFSTRSIYNGDPSTYDARHNAMTEDEFRHYIERNAKRHANEDAQPAAPEGRSAGFAPLS